MQEPNKKSYPSKEFLEGSLPKFYPYVYVCSDVDRPDSISAAAWSGGSTKRILLNDGATLSDVQKEIRGYLQKYKGLCPIFGHATAFLWARTKTEGTLFGLDAEVIGERTGDFWPPRMEIQKTMVF
jgi:hypothetical protein